MKRMKHEEVTIQVAPMLDMAFQLLTFFILTYRPMPVEGQFTMNLLPAAPAIDMNAEAPAQDQAQGNPDLPAALKTLTTNVVANADGGLERIVLGEAEFTNVDQLRDRLKEIVADKTLPFDQAKIVVDPNLRYEELMKIIDAFANPEVNLTKLAFEELTDSGGAAL